MPIILCFLLVAEGPVKNLLLGKFSHSYRFERCTRKVQRKFAVDFVKGFICFVSIYTLMRFVDDEQIPVIFAHPS